MPLDNKYELSEYNIVIDFLSKIYQEICKK